MLFLARFFLSAAFFSVVAVSHATPLSGELFVGGPAGGPASSWSIEVTNTGAITATSAELTSITLTQTGGAACTPVFGVPFPILLGDIASGATADSPNLLPNLFNGCGSTASFTLDAEFSAMGGAETGSLVLQDIAVDQPIGLYPTPTIAVPEPSSVLLLGAGLAGLFGAIRLRAFRTARPKLA